MLGSKYSNASIKRNNVVYNNRTNPDLQYSMLCRQPLRPGSTVPPRPCRTNAGGFVILQAGLCIDMIDQWKMEDGATLCMRGAHWRYTSKKTDVCRLCRMLWPSGAVSCRMLCIIPAPGRVLGAEEMLFELLKFLRCRRLNAMMVPVSAGGVQAHQNLLVFVKE